MGLRSYNRFGTTSSSELILCVVIGDSAGFGVNISDSVHVPLESPTPRRCSPFGRSFVMVVMCAMRKSVTQSLALSVVGLVGTSVRPRGYQYASTPAHNDNGNCHARPPPIHSVRIVQPAFTGVVIVRLGDEWPKD